MAVLALFAAAGPATAQIRVDEGTEVLSIDFRGNRTIPERRLRAMLETRSRGLGDAIQSVFAFLPLVPAPERHIFRPLALQRDVVRLREFYRDQGFLESTVRYEAASQPARNRILITFQIVEGPPTRVVETRITGPDGESPPEIAPSDRGSWTHIERSVRRQRGRRLQARGADRRERRISNWWKDHGHPSADTDLRIDADSVRREASLRYVVMPGPSARFGAIAVPDSGHLSRDEILRELPFRTGDPYSSSALDEGRESLEQLDLIRTAGFELGGVAADSTPSDSALARDPDIPVSVEIYEAKLRQIGGDLGYGSDAGATAEASWSHRNFTGGARTFTVAAVAQTGKFAIAENPDQRYRGSVSLLQPYFFHRRVSALFSPYIEHRDDVRDRSLEVGANTTLIARASSNRSLSLDYHLARRHIEEYRFNEFANGEIDLLSLFTLASEGLLDSALDSRLVTSTLTLSGRIGNLDQPVNPRYGLLFRPAVQVTMPAGLSTTEYWRLDATANGFLPLRSNVQLAARAGYGRLFPFGRGLPASGVDATFKLIELRDVLQTAGGSADVRGWGNRMLGPKIPDLKLRALDDSTLVVVAEGYDAIGGFEKTTFSLELRLPFPGLSSQFGTHVFLDGGRVWTSDARFGGDEPVEYGEENWFYAAGGGFDLRTPVGPIRLSVGYKLNPGLLDVANSSDILDVLLGNRTIESVPRHNRYRWQLHLVIGSGL